MNHGAPALYPAPSDIHRVKSNSFLETPNRNVESRTAPPPVVQSSLGCDKRNHRRRHHRHHRHRRHRRHHRHRHRHYHLYHNQHAHHNHFKRCVDTRRTVAQRVALWKADRRGEHAPSGTATHTPPPPNHCQLTSMMTPMMTSSPHLQSKHHRAWGTGARSRR